MKTLQDLQDYGFKASKVNYSVRKQEMTLAHEEYIITTIIGFENEIMGNDPKDVSIYGVANFSLRSDTKLGTMSPDILYHNGTHRVSYMIEALNLFFKEAQVKPLP